MCLLYLLTVVVVRHGFKPNIRPGQTWVSTYNYNHNPFEKDRYDTMYVLDVKGKFVQYREWNHIYSESKYWFYVNAHLVKNK